MIHLQFCQILGYLNLTLFTVSLTIQELGYVEITLTQKASKILGKWGFHSFPFLLYAPGGYKTFVVGFEKKNFARKLTCALQLQGTVGAPRTLGRGLCDTDAASLPEGRLALGRGAGPR